MKVIIFCAGNNTVKFLKSCQFLDAMEILFIMDNDTSKWGSMIGGYEVVSPERLKSETYDKILVTAYFEEIREQLMADYDVPDDKITRADYVIVPALCNLGSISLQCEQEQCCDIAHLNRDEVVTDNPLEEFFFWGEHRIAHKGWHYFEVYHQYFQKYIGKPVRILEIGVCKGGSLQMWKHYFGEKSVVVGVDIDSSCKQYEDEEDDVHVCIGSQDDPDFLQKVCEKWGPFDIVLDDGSHMMKHQIDSFRILFPLLREGGIYLCEDTCTCYWPAYEGELRGNTFIEFAKDLVDEMHHQYINQKDEVLFPQFRNQISGIHFYDSMVVFEKRKTGLSIFSMRGKQ